MTNPVFESTFREWIADRVKDFSEALKNGADPEVTFVVALNGFPSMTMQVRLIDCEGVFTREDAPLNIVLEGRK